MTDDINSTFLDGMVNRQRFMQNDTDHHNTQGDRPDNEDTILSEDEMSNITDHVHEHENIEDQIDEHLAEQVPPIQETKPICSTRAPPTEASIFNEKKSCLVEIRRLRSRGAFFARQYTFEDDISDMKQGLELARIEMIQTNKDIRNKTGIKTARRILLAAVSVLEFGTKKWNPLNLHLDGFGEYVMTNLSDYDGIFERLLEKYAGKGTMEPELELLITLGTSAVMFHVSNKFVENACKAASTSAPKGNTEHADEDVNRFEDD